MASSVSVVEVVVVVVALAFSSDAGAEIVAISSASNKTEESPTGAAGGAVDDGEDGSTVVALGAEEVGVDEEDAAETAAGCLVDNRMSNAFKANALYITFPLILNGIHPMNM